MKKLWLIAILLVVASAAIAERRAPLPPQEGIIVSEGGCAWMAFLDATIGLPPGAWTTTQLTYGSNPVTPTCTEYVWMPSESDWQASGDSTYYPDSGSGS
jgi:hypothetical protein